MTESHYPARLLFLRHGVERFEKLGFLKTFAADFLVVAQGSPVRHCYVVRRGRVISFEMTPSGERQVYNFMEEGSLLLEMNLLFDRPAAVNFMTTIESELICIDKTSLLKAMAADQQLTLDIMESATDKFFSSMDQIRQERYRSAEWKICNLLLIFAERYGVPHDDSVLITEKVSQQMISSLLGLNRITTVRLIKEMRARGLIEQVSGYYHVVSLAQLKQRMADILFQKS